MNKKGTEMSLNVIIIAAIGLLILVILSFLVINYVSKTKTGLESCNAKGGVCSASCSNSEDVIPSVSGCSGTKPTCCKLLS